MTSLSKDHEVQRDNFLIVQYILYAYHDHQLLDDLLITLDEKLGPNKLNDLLRYTVEESYEYIEEDIRTGRHQEV